MTARTWQEGDPELACCDLHGRNCEPPSELCCGGCTEAAHPAHTDGSTCSNPDLSGPYPDPPGESEERQFMNDGLDLSMLMESICPSSLAAHIDPSRPYDGQAHTDLGTRGATEVHGVTFRDILDAFIRACYESSGLPIEQWPGSVYDLPWPDMDILAVAQNLSCNIEKAMGIYPNVPRLLPADPSEPHWCGWPINAAEWVLGHDGQCPDVAAPPAGEGAT